MTPPGNHAPDIIFTARSLSEKAHMVMNGAPL